MIRKLHSVALLVALGASGIFSVGARAENTTKTPQAAANNERRQAGAENPSGVPADPALAGAQTLAGPVGPPLPLLDEDSRRLSFQALLTDVDGEPLAGDTVELIFNIYNAGGAVIEGPITMNSVSMEGGIVSVQIPVSVSTFNGEAREIGVSLNGGVEVAPRVPLTAVAYAYRVDRVASGELDDAISLGAGPPNPASGFLLLYSAAAGGPRISLDGSAGIVGADGAFNVLGGGGGAVRATMTAGAGGGRLRTEDASGGNAVVSGGHAANGGGFAEYYQSGGTLGISLLGDGGSGSTLTMNDNSGDATVQVDSQGPTTGGAVLALNNSEGATTVSIDADLSDGALVKLGNSNAADTIVFNADVSDAGEISVRDGAGAQTLLADGAAGAVRALRGLEVLDGWGSFVLAQVFKEGGNGWFESFASDGERTSKLGGGLDAGGRLLLYDAAGSVRILADGDDGDGAGRVEVSADSGNARVILDAERSGADDGGSVVVIGNGGSRIKLHGSYEGVGNTGSWMEMRDGNTATSPRIVLEARNVDAGSGGRIRINNGAGDNTINLVGDASGDGIIVVKNDSGTSTARLMGDNGSDGGLLRLVNSLAEITATLSAGADGGSLRLNNHATEVVYLGRSGTGSGSLFEMSMSDGTDTIELVADVGGVGAGSILRMRDGSGANTVVLDGRTGWTSTKVLEITGGSDFSEKFDVSPAQGSPRPGMVVSIDPRNPGALVASATAYDRKVAGVISGAGGVSTGMMMGQPGTLADGSHPVALSGRVYCYAEARGHAIEPGDLLTTSSLAGHAMRVSDHSRSAGAVIGKAMTGLNAGQTGLVLVLVNLQ